MRVIQAPRPWTLEAHGCCCLTQGQAQPWPRGRGVLPTPWVRCRRSGLCPPLTLVFVAQAVFTLLLGPFAFFDVQKTKYLQILTSLMRWIGESERHREPPAPRPFRHLS